MIARKAVAARVVRGCMPCLMLMIVFNAGRSAEPVPDAAGVPMTTKIAALLGGCVLFTLPILAYEPHALTLIPIASRQPATVPYPTPHSGFVQHLPQANGPGVAATLGKFPGLMTGRLLP